MSRVSIVLPVRNAAGTLDECLESIAQQSFKDYEALVVDDGSVDDSAELVHRWAKLDERIKLIRQPALGLAKALNRGLFEATAPLIARMDADDIMHSERLAKQVAYLEERPVIGLVATQVRLFPENQIQFAANENLQHRPLMYWGAGRITGRRSNLLVNIVLHQQPGWTLMNEK